MYTFTQGAELFMKCIQFQFSDVHLDTTDNLYYQLLRERKENLLTNRLPYNGFEEMIKLTSEGKMWHYPIDNEQGTNGNLSTSVQKFFLKNKVVENNV